MERNIEKETKEAVANISKNLGTMLGRAGAWLLSAAFIMWGYNTFAPLVNAPQFTYWEIFAMRIALSSIVGIFYKRK